LLSVLAFVFCVAGAGNPESQVQAADKTVKKTTAKLDQAGISRLIDAQILEKLQSAKVSPVGQADDAEFLRRVYLDLIGNIPTAKEAADFLDSKDPQKRAKLIDALLARPEFGSRLADIWTGMMIPRDSMNRRLTPKPLHDWLAKNFNDNVGWDKLTYELLTATGKTDENGAVTFFLANATIDKINGTVAKLFLGNQLQCCQCHNHPFTDWKQNDYWGMAAFYIKVRPDNVNQAVKAGNAPGITEANVAGKPRVLMNVENYKNLPPKFLAAEAPKVNASEPLRPVLAKWLTTAENPYFSKAMVNRMWAHFFGRGFINPIDDMHDENPASHPELLNDLAHQFSANGFDLKFLIRAICNSQTYQRTSKPAGDQPTDAKLFGQMQVKPMSPEQLFDSLAKATGAMAGGAAKPNKPNKPALVGNARDQFIAFFQTDEGADPLEYHAGVPHALRLMNSAQMNRGGTVLDEAAKLHKTPEGIIEHLYLGTLSRRPTPPEVTRMKTYLDKNGSDTRKAYSDMFWVLLNCSEFAITR
jgi:hypothetical protein